VVKLAKCFGLTAKSAEYLSQIRNARVLDLGDGCGAVQHGGLLKLLVDDKNELAPLLNTVETLILSRGDFISERTLIRFLTVLTSFPPNEMRLSTLDLSCTYCVSPEVLECVYASAAKSTASPSLDKATSKPAHQRPFHIDLRQCDLLTRADVQALKDRLDGYRRRDERFGCWTAVTSAENCKFSDTSSESVLRYLQAMHPLLND
jgi:hypothetical protein